MKHQVRTHKVRRDGKTYTRSRHDRSDRGARVRKLRPSRAWRNAKRANLSAKQRKHWTAGLFAAAAVTEIAAWAAVGITGRALFLAGMGIALIGAGLKAKT